MDLGVFSISLGVKDLAASRAFYEKLGFVVTGGDPAQKYLILVNGRTVIGLFEGNILTFNPGWIGPHEEAPPDFTDVREIAAHLDARGVDLATRELPEEGGPGHITFADPDRNQILIDQHR
jgi:catechol 2,3-dioxygenase-like lactoylglutathione lyase family enzyme